MTNHWETVCKLSSVFFPALAHVVNLMIRCWLGYVYVDSGLQQIHAWEATQLLFQYEYHVPLIHFSTAAILAVGVELIVAPLLAFGMAGRIPAIILFIFNCVAMWSYPIMFTTAGGEVLEDHLYWGLLLLVIIGYGNGVLSFDNIMRYFWRKNQTL